MKSIALDIIVISADGLKSVNTFSRMDVYVQVSISTDPNIKNNTSLHKNGGTNPKWNHSMKFNLQESSVTHPTNFLIFHLKSNRTFGDKEIGRVFVPIRDLFNQFTSTSHRIMQYPVITETGESKGTLRFSYKFGDKFTHANNDPVTAYPLVPYGGAYGSHPGSGYPQPGHGGYPPLGYPPATAPVNGYPPLGYPTATAPVHGYPPLGPAGYPPAAAPAGYGYPAAVPPPHGYGYFPVQQSVKRKNKSGGVGGLGLGLGAGLLGGMLVGDMVSDAGDRAAYGDGYGDAMADISGFDF